MDRSPKFRRGGLVMMCVALTLASAIAPRVWACKYSVRDVGFVPIDDADHRLTLVLPEDATDEVIARWRSALIAACVPIGLDPEVTQSDTDQPVWSLRTADGRAIPLGPPPDEPGGIADALAGVQLGLPGLGEVLLDHFALIVVVTPEDGAPGAVEAAQRAATQLGEVMPKLEKPAGAAPRVGVVTAGDIAAHAPGWAVLGVDVADASSLPAAVVLYGRGRRIGPVYRGEALTAERLFATLAILGGSCECSLDRGWLYGPRAVLPWGDAELERARRLLTFDPADPMVRLEVRAIVQKPAEPLSRLSPLDQAPTYEQLILGYREYDLDALLTPLDGGEASSTTPVADAGAGATGDDPVSTPAPSSGDVPSTASDAGATERTGEGEGSGGGVPTAVFIALGAVLLCLGVVGVNVLGRRS